MHNGWMDANWREDGGKLKCGEEYKTTDARVARDEATRGRDARE